MQLRVRLWETTQEGREMALEQPFGLPTEVDKIRADFLEGMTQMKDFYGARANAKVYKAREQVIDSV